jgi:hypothetical protein
MMSAGSMSGDSPVGGMKGVAGAADEQDEAKVRKMLVSRSRFELRAKRGFIFIMKKGDRRGRPYNFLFFVG